MLVLIKHIATEKLRAGNTTCTAENVLFVLSICFFPCTNFKIAYSLKSFTLTHNKSYKRITMTTKTMMKQFY